MKKNSRECKDRLIDCFDFIKEEVERWWDRSVTLEEINYFSNHKNWRQVSRKTVDGTTTRLFLCCHKEVKLQGTILNWHNGYRVSLIPH